MKIMITGLYFALIVVIMQLMMLKFKRCDKISRLAQLITYFILIPAKIIWLIPINIDLSIVLI
jgi:hypothetical protein